jgi:hypothetical protein
VHENATRVTAVHGDLGPQFLDLRNIVVIRAQKDRSSLDRIVYDRCHSESVGWTRTWRGKSTQESVPAVHLYNCHLCPRTCRLDCCHGQWPCQQADRPGLIRSQCSNCAVPDSCLPVQDVRRWKGRKDQRPLKLSRINRRICLARLEGKFLKAQTLARFFPSLLSSNFKVNENN